MRASEITIPSATGSAPPESPVPGPAGDEGNRRVVADADDGLHLRRRAGQRDERGDHAPAGEPVALVGPQLLRLADHVGRSREPLDQLRCKAHRLNLDRSA